MRKSQLINKIRYNQRNIVEEFQRYYTTKANEGFWSEEEKVEEKLQIIKDQIDFYKSIIIDLESQLQETDYFPMCKPNCDGMCHQCPLHHHNKFE